VTADGVDFRICLLYQGRSGFQHGIIVEVQRRFGTSLHFHSDAQAILDDVMQGKTPAPVQKNVLPEVSDEDSDMDECPPPPSGSSSLAMVERMLAFPGFDAQYLGLQTLSALVDPDKMSPQTARRTAQALLKAQSAVGEEILGYITTRKTNNESHNRLRIMALVGILVNSTKASGIIPDFFRLALRPVLLDDLMDAKANPLAALLAAKCMEYFICGDHDDTIELNDGFETSRKVGEELFLALKEQAERCMRCIQ